MTMSETTADASGVALTAGLDASNREKQEWVATQFRMAMGPQPMIECGCGLKMPLRFAYRCLYCGEYYCLACAEVHFGMTRSEYRARQTSNQIEQAVR